MVDVVLNSRAQPVYLVNPFNGEPYTLATAVDGATALALGAVIAVPIAVYKVV